MKRIFCLTSLLLILCSCSGNSSASSEETILDYDDLSEYKINLEDMYNQKDNEYYVYLYSKFCTGCYYLKQDLFSYFDNGNSKNLYITDISELDGDISDYMDFKESYDFESNLNNILGVTSLKNTVFSYTPCIYKIKKESDINTLVDIVYQYEKIRNFFQNN